MASLTQGIIGYNINFNHNTVTRSDSRRLDTAYSPDQRLFTITVTQKGLNRLQDWINSATSTGDPHDQERLPGGADGRRDHPGALGADGRDAGQPAIQWIRNR